MSNLTHTTLPEAPEKLPPQSQDQKPGLESEMNPAPIYDDENYCAANKLLNKTALITGGDSGIGRSISLLYAKEGANIAIVYLSEDEDAQKTKKLVEAQGRSCLLIKGDITSETFCQQAVQQTVTEYGKLDILINNAGEHYSDDNIDDLPTELLERTFKTNIFSMFYFTKAALKHLKAGSSIINTASVTAYKGSGLLAYSSTKGAVVSFTRSLSQALVKKGIRVNGVAPGPIWTPLIPATVEPEKVAAFGKDRPMERPGQPYEVAPCYVFLASSDSSYMCGQILHPNGGDIVNA